MAGRLTLIFLIMATAIAIAAANTDQDMINATEPTDWTISTTETVTSTESSPLTETTTLTEAATATTTPAATTLTAEERNATHSTTPKAAKAEDSHHAPPWVIVLITFCFIHLVGGVVFTMVTKYKKGQLYIFARLRKRDSIMPAGPPATSDKKSAQPVEPALPESESGKMEKIGESARSVKTPSEGAATAKTAKSDMSSADTMQGMSGIPGEGKGAMPSAAKNGGNGVGTVENLNKSQTKMSTVKM